MSSPLRDKVDLANDQMGKFNFTSSRYHSLSRKTDTILLCIYVIKHISKTAFFFQEEHRVKLCAGQTFTLTGNKDFWDKGDDTKVAISFPELGDYVKPGMKVYLDFGTVAIKITGAGSYKF